MAALSGALGAVCGNWLGESALTNRANSLRKGVPSDSMANAKPQIDQIWAIPKEQDDVVGKTFDNEMIKESKMPREADEEFKEDLKQAQSLISNGKITRARILKADGLLQQCEQLLKTYRVIDESADPPAIGPNPAIIQVKRGYCACFLGQLKAAEQFADKAIAWSRNLSHSDKGWFECDLAGLYETMGLYYLDHGTTNADFKRALDFNKRACSIFQDYSVAPEQMAICEHREGLVQFQKLKNFDNAIDSFTKAKHLFETIHAEQTDTYIGNSLLLGQVYSQIGKFAQAEKIYQQMLPLTEKLAHSGKCSPGLLLNCYTGMASFETRLGKPKQAKEHELMAAKWTAKTERRD